MNKTLLGVLAVVIGILVGSVVNMGLITLGYSIFPLEGVDPNDMEALGEALKTADAKHFLFPFLAHALGALTGAIVAAVVAPAHKMRYALGLGVLFLLGGIAASFMIPAPTWFIAADILLAYVPMAWLGGKIGIAIRPGSELSS